MEPVDQTYDGFISYSHAADDLLAPRLQSALQRFAKPWWKRRAVRIFRDESSLSANPHLWSSITEALDTSGWFVLLLSPDAARSEWVSQEISYWVEHRDPKKMLPVVTDGEFAWSDGDVAGDAVPDVLRGVFDEEPRWVDIRWAKDEEQLDLKHPGFNSAIADIASTLRGVPKDELESEEVRQHRRTVRTAWAAGGLVAALAVVSVGFAAQSADNAAEAARQAEIAEVNAAEAENNAEEANAQRAAAEAEAGRADDQAALARSRELAASAVNVLQSDPELSILLALESIEAAPPGREPGFESLVALREATHESSVVARVDVGDNDCFLEVARRCALSPDGLTYVSTSPPSGTVSMFDSLTWEPRWIHETTREVTAVQFSHDGKRLAVSYGAVTQETDEMEREAVIDGAAVAILDGVTGEVLLERSFDRCVTADVLSLSPTGEEWVVSLPSEAGCSDGIETDDGRVALLEFTTLDTVGGFDSDAWVGVATWLPDGDRIVVSVGETGPRLVEVATGQVLAEAPGSDFWNHAISPDGSLVAAAALTDRSVWLFETDTMVQRDRLTGLPDAVEGLRFSDDGHWVIAGSAGDGVIVWDVDSGEHEHVLKATGPGWSLDLDDEESLLYVAGPNGEISTWDLSGTRQGEIDTVDINSWVQSNSIVGTRSQAAFTSFLFPDFDAIVRTFGPDSGQLDASIDVNLYWGPAVLPDGRLVVFPEPSPDEAGPVVVWDPEDDSRIPLVGCHAFKGDGNVAFLEEGEAVCIDGGDDWLPAVGLWVDPAGERLLISTADGEMLTFDARTLEFIERAFFDDGSSGVEAFGGDWIVFSDSKTNLPVGTTKLTIVDTESFEVITEFRGAVPEIDEVGSRLSVHDLDGGIDIYDTTTWERVAKLRAGEARIRGLEFSPGGSMLASGAVDGFLRIWDVEAGVELHRIPIESPSDAYWIDDEHLVVGTQWGLWTTITLNTDELVDIALDRLTRGLTTEECATYRIDPCPTLEDVRSR